MTNYLRINDDGDYNLLNICLYLYFPSARLATFENAHDFYDFQTFTTFDF